MNQNNKLTPDDINACIATKLLRFVVHISYQSDYYSEGTIDGDFQFAGFKTPRGTVIFVEYLGGYRPTFFTDGFWTNEKVVYGHNTEECFQLCVDILHTQPNAIHHNEALFNVLKKYAQPTSLVA